MNPERRRWLGTGLAAVGAGSLLAVVGRFALPYRTRDLSRRVRIGLVDELPAGSSTYLPGPDVHVIHEAGGLYALSGRCTHLGCSVLRQAEGFSCPCHGARFDLRGLPVAGPAQRPLRWLELELGRDRHLVLQLDRTVEHGNLLRI